MQDLIGYLILLQIAIADSGAWKGENGYDKADPWKELDNDYLLSVQIDVEVPDNIYK